MKIYVPEINIFNIDFTLIEDCIVSVIKKRLLWCEDRLLEIKNNKIHNVNIIGKDSIIKKIDDLEIIIDLSYIETITNDQDIESIQYHIPPNHIEEQITIKKYQITDIFNFVLIVEESKNINTNRILNDFYFYINTSSYSKTDNIEILFNLEKENIKNKMHTFLTRLKLCN